MATSVPWLFYKQDNPHLLQDEDTYQEILYCQQNVSYNRKQAEIKPLSVGVYPSVLIAIEYSNVRKYDCLNKWAFAYSPWAVSNLWLCSNHDCSVCDSIRSCLLGSEFSE